MGLNYCSDECGHIGVIERNFCFGIVLISTIMASGKFQTMEYAGLKIEYIFHTTDRILWKGIVSVACSLINRNMSGPTDGDSENVCSALQFFVDLVWMRLHSSNFSAVSNIHFAIAK